jgi:hypothetical protein
MEKLKYMKLIDEYLKDIVSHKMFYMKFISTLEDDDDIQYTSSIIFKTDKSKHFKFILKMLRMFHIKYEVIYTKETGLNQAEISILEDFTEDFDF